MVKRAGRVILAFAAILGIGIAGAGTAIASVPDSSGVIHACHQSPLPAHGAALNVIDTGAGGSCAGGQVPVSWQSGQPETIYAPYMLRLPFTVPNDGQTHVFNVQCNAVTGHDVLMGLTAIVTEEGGGYAPYAPMSNLSLSSYGYANSGYVYALGNSSSGPVQDLEVDLSCAKVGP